MMRNIHISDSTLTALGALARPFIDKEPEDVIKWLIAERLSNNTAIQEAASPAGSADAVKTFKPDAAPDMAFTRVKSFKMDDVSVVEKAQLYWNPILFAIVGKAATKLGAEELKKHLLVNYIDGKGQEQQGYRFIQEAGLSVQGSDANTVWRAIFALVKVIGMKIEVEFYWEDKPKAAYPNATGRFVYGG